MVFGGLQPSEFDELTLVERDEIAKALDKRNRKH